MIRICKEEFEILRDGLLRQLKEGADRKLIESKIIDLVIIYGVSCNWNFHHRHGESLFPVAEVA